MANEKVPSVVFDKYYDGKFPDQLLTRAEKIEKYGSIENWVKYVMDSVDALGFFSLNQYLDVFNEVQINYELVEGKLDTQDFKHVLEPYSIPEVKVNLPAKFHNYNIISPKVSLLEGEERKRPFTFQAIVVNNEAVSMMMEKKKQMLQEYFQSEILRTAQELGLITQDEQGQMQPMTPEEIDAYFKFSYKDAREKAANEALEFVYKYNDLQTLFNYGWANLLIAGSEIYWTGIVNNEPVCRLIDRRTFMYDRHAELRNIEDAEWAKEWRYITVSKVYEEFYNDLQPEHYKLLESLRDNNPMVLSTHNTAAYTLPTSSVPNVGRGYGDINSNSIVKVEHIEWVAKRKIGIYKYIDEEGKQQETMVDEEFKADKKDPSFISIDWKWINEVWEATRIGSDIILNARPKPNVYRSMDNPSKVRLGFTGIEMPTSMVSKLKPLQYLYNIIMFRLEMAFARAKGNGIIIDVAQIATDYGLDLEKTLYYFDLTGVLPINSFQEGTRGASKGKTPAFNQFQKFDLGVSSTIASYFQMLQKIEQMAADISGISDARIGQTFASETVGGIERSIQQSSATTEALFQTHAKVKECVLTRMVENCQLSWRNGKKSQYFTSDSSRVLVDIDGEIFSNAEFGVFISDQSRDKEVFDIIRQVAPSMMQTGNLSMKHFLQVMETNSVAHARKIMEVAEELAKQEAQAMQEQQLQAQQQIADAQNEVKMQELALKEQELAMKDQINIRDNEVKLMIAQLSQDDTEDTSLEQKQMELAVEKEISKEEMNLKQRELQENLKLKQKELQIKEQLEREKIASNERVNKIKARQKPKPAKK